MVDEILDSEPLWHENPPKVVAILVAHRAERWLPTALESHARLDFEPAAWRVVHDGTDAKTTEIIDQHFDATQVVDVQAGLGFGDKVAAAINQAPPADWYWLLHDDVILEPASLSGLLNEATLSETIGAVGPKVREWPSLRRLLEVGLTITGTGHRELGLEPGEPDAGQHDRPKDVLAVGTAGMLVRRSAWQELNGFDPNLPLFGDDIDFGWRLNKAGWNVRTAPQSVVFHAEASRGLRRNRRGGVRQKVGERRSAGLYTLLVNESPARFPLVWVRLFFGCWIRALGFVVGKDFKAFRRELAALLTVFGSPGRIFKARSARKAISTRRNRDFLHLRPNFWHPYLHGLDVARAGLANYIRAEEEPFMGHRAIGGGLDERDLLTPERPAPVWRRWPWVTLVFALCVFALVAARSLAPGSVHSAVLLAPPNQVLDWWMLVVGRAHAIGVGSVDWPSTAVIPMAALSTAVWFKPGIAIWAILVFAVPMAAVTAHRFGRQLTDDRIPRMLWALSYGLLVATSGAVAGGRIGTVVALILMPVIASALWRLVEDPNWVRVAQTAFVISLASAFASIVWWIILPVVFVIAWRWPSVRRSLAAMFLLSSILLGPALFTRVFAGPRVWWEAGAPVDVDPSVLGVVFGLGGASGQAPWWLMVPVVLVGLIALVPSETRWAVTLSWSFAVVMLAFALTATTVTFTPSVGLAEVSAWAGVPAVLWLMGLLTAALFAAPAARMRSYRKYLKPAFVLMLLFPVLGLSWFVGRGVADPLVSEAPPSIPAYLSDAGVTTMVLTGNLEDGIEVRVVSELDGVFGTEGMGPNRERTADLKTLVESLLSRPSAAEVNHLAQIGIGAVYSPDVDANTERRIDSVPGLSPAGTDRAESRVWTVTGSINQEPADEASIFRPILGSVWLMLWLGVAVMALPFSHTVTEEEEQ